MTIAWTRLAAAGFTLLTVGCKSSDTVAPLTCATSTLNGVYGVQSNGQVAPGIRVTTVGIAIPNLLIRSQQSLPTVAV